MKVVPLDIVPAVINFTEQVIVAVTLETWGCSVRISAILEKVFVVFPSPSVQIPAQHRD
jgi:hypothetical protein